MKIVIPFFLIFFLSATFSLFGQVEIFPYVENGKIGYRKISDSSVVITPKWDYIEDFIPGYSWTVTGSGKFELLSNRIDKREVKFTGKFGFIGDKGDIIFPPVFDMVISFSPEYAIIGEGEGNLIFTDFPEEKNISFSGELGLINQKGEMLIYPGFNSIHRVDHPEKSLWLAEKGDSSYLFLNSINLNINRDIDDIDSYTDGLARFRIDNKYGYLNDKGEIVIKAYYSKASRFKNGKALVKRDKRFFLIDSSGKKLENEPLQFDKMDDFSEGFARVSILDEFGYIKPDSTFYKYPQYLEATPFFNSVAYVSDTDSFGYIFTDKPDDLVGKYENNPINRMELKDSLPDKLKELNSVDCNSKKENWFFNPISHLDLTELARIALEAVRWAPYLQKNFTNIFASVSASEGTLAGRTDFNISCISVGNPEWEEFKKKVLLNIIADPVLREVTWGWIKSFLYRSFHSMPEIHQDVYKQMLNYLEQYYSNYNLEKTREFLIEHEEEFAYYHADGSTSPFRITSALIDRLILVYKVIEPEDVELWISRIKKELNN